ncbi:hypothetical protein ES319_A09G203100v1 [Gossypium barbadense]|uniref:Uncharacterized protein n=1 Tax=Gossypium barbadense TaxID=3634 RepID=A0A5J5UGG0_GOSBA|nr:hypothetical protein ES319_A09G203100v1 [Gossypium barbadense]
MDVYIPEEYVIRRRMEKKAAALAGKRTPNMVAETEVSKKMENKSKLPPAFRFDRNELLVGGGISETVVFSCLSA